MTLGAIRVYEYQDGLPHWWHLHLLCCCRLFSGTRLPSSRDIAVCCHQITIRIDPAAEFLNAQRMGPASHVMPPFNAHRQAQARLSHGMPPALVSAVSSTARDGERMRNGRRGKSVMGGPVPKSGGMFDGNVCGCWSIPAEGWRNANVTTFGAVGPVLLVRHVECCLLCLAALGTD